MTAQMPDYTITRRVHAVWKKLSDWYGADVIAKNFGAIPPREWCEAIDGIASRQGLDQVLSEMRAKHVIFPPRFPEFEALLARAARPAQTMQLRENDATWRKLKETDLVEYEIQYRIAFAARMVLILPRDNQAYQEWEREYAKWGALRFAARAAQSAAITNALPLSQWARAA